MREDLETRPVDLLDPAQLDVARAWVGVHAAVQRDLFGDRGSAWTLEEVQGFVRGSDKKRVARGVWGGDRSSVRSRCTCPARHLRSAVLLAVGRAVRARTRVGSALVAEAERIAAEHGRSTCSSRPSGRRAGRTRREAFATARGFVVAQTVLRSEQSPRPTARPRGARRRAGCEDYRLESWSTTCGRVARGPCAPPAADEHRRALRRPRPRGGGLGRRAPAGQPRRARASVGGPSSGGAARAQRTARRFTTSGSRPVSRASATSRDTLVLTGEHRGHGSGCGSRRPTRCGSWTSCPR